MTQRACPRTHPAPHCRDWTSLETMSSGLRPVPPSLTASCARSQTRLMAPCCHAPQPPEPRYGGPQHPRAEANPTRFHRPGRPFPASRSPPGRCWHPHSCSCSWHASVGRCCCFHPLAAAAAVRLFNPRCYVRGNGGPREIAATPWHVTSSFQAATCCLVLVYLYCGGSPGGSRGWNISQRAAAE